MGDMTRCPKCATFHYRNDPCPDDDRPLERTKLFELDNVSESVTAQIPERVLLAINNYVWHGQPTGDFVRAVLSNELQAAIGRADDRSLKAIESICCYVYNAVPSALVGSPERYAKHIANAKMKTHADFIMEATGCQREEVSKIYDVMRHGIFHSTLDWQTREQIDEAAVLAFSVIKAAKEEEQLTSLLRSVINKQAKKASRV